MNSSLLPLVPVIVDHLRPLGGVFLHPPSVFLLQLVLVNNWNPRPLLLELLPVPLAYRVPDQHGCYNDSNDAADDDGIGDPLVRIRLYPRAQELVLSERKTVHVGHVYLRLVLQNGCVVG